MSQHGKQKSKRIIKRGIAKRVRAGEGRAHPWEKRRHDYQSVVDALEAARDYVVRCGVAGDHQETLATINAALRGAAKLGVKPTTGYRVVYGEARPAWEQIFPTKRAAEAFANKQRRVGDVIFSVKKVVPGEPPQSMTAAIEQAQKKGA